MIRELMTQEAKFALAAFGAGNLARYELHRANTRRLADHLTLQEAQEQERRERRSVYLAPGVVQGPKNDADFLRQDNALTACIRWCLAGLAVWLLICAAAGFIARYFGWL